MLVKRGNTTFQFLDWSRYSSRQERKIKMARLIGEATNEGDLAEFLPYLRIGEKVHIGKGTASD